MVFVLLIFRPCGIVQGVTIILEGDSNDGCGKALSGGTIAVFPSKAVVADGFAAEANVVVGNVCLYGASSGEAFFCGKVCWKNN